jgi:hypothetical protein
MSSVSQSIDEAGFSSVKKPPWACTALASCTDIFRKVVPAQTLSQSWSDRFGTPSR